MENNQDANGDQAPNVGWSRGQESALQLGLATFLCLAAAIIGGSRPFLGLFALAGAIALILEQLTELIYHLKEAMTKVLGLFAFAGALRLFCRFMVLLPNFLNVLFRCK